MKLREAQEILREVSGRSASWMAAWGLSLIRAAIRTVRARAAATNEDLRRAEEVWYKLERTHQERTERKG